jgi:glycosyl hydrolase family 26
MSCGYAEGNVTRAATTALAVLTLALSLAGCGDGDPEVPRLQSTLRPGVAPTPPSQGAYFGAWVNPPLDGHDRQRRLDAVGTFERNLGRKMDIVHTYRTWRQPFPREADTHVLNGNSRLLLSWNGTDTKMITSGQSDPLIRKRAQAIKATGKPIFLRWQWEMDRPNIRTKIRSPAAFIAAWKHIRDIFRQEGVDNVAWVWCPTAKGFEGTGRDQAARYYPGDDQVDWICADAYPGIEYEYRELSEAMRAFMEWAKAHPKPIMIGEFGVPRSYGTRRAEWLRKAAQTLQNPQIKAVIYFDSDMQDRGADARQQYSLEGDRQAMSAMREFATTPYFNPLNVPVTSN